MESLEILASIMGPKRVARNFALLHFRALERSPLAILREFEVHFRIKGEAVWTYVRRELLAGVMPLDDNQSTEGLVHVTNRAKIARLDSK